jgi:hypothetical protein
MYATCWWSTRFCVLAGDTLSRPKPTRGSISTPGHVPSQGMARSPCPCNESWNRSVLTEIYLPFTRRGSRPPPETSPPSSGASAAPPVHPPRRRCLARPRACAGRRSCPASRRCHRLLLMRRARNASGTATQCTRRNDSPPLPPPSLSRRCSACPAVSALNIS